MELDLGRALRIVQSLDLMRPEYRGPIAEALVAHATHGDRDEGWGYDAQGTRAPDVRTAEGISVEVKSSGDTDFKGGTRTAKYVVPKKLDIDVVVLAHLSRRNALDLDRWSFHVLPAKRLRPGQSISIAMARKMVDPVSFEDLAGAIAVSAARRA